MGTRQALLLLIAAACAHAVPLSGRLRGVPAAHAQAVPLSELLRKGEHPSKLQVYVATCNSLSRACVQSVAVRQSERQKWLGFKGKEVKMILLLMLLHPFCRTHPRSCSATSPRTRGFSQ